MQLLLPLPLLCYCCFHFSLVLFSFGSVRLSTEIGESERDPKSNHSDSHTHRTQILLFVWASTGEPVISYADSVCDVRTTRHIEPNGKQMRFYYLSHKLFSAMASESVCVLCWCVDRMLMRLYATFFSLSFSLSSMGPSYFIISFSLRLLLVFGLSCYCCWPWSWPWHHHWCFICGSVCFSFILFTFFSVIFATHFGILRLGANARNGILEFGANHTVWLHTKTHYLHCMRFGWMKNDQRMSWADVKVNWTALSLSSAKPVRQALCRSFDVTFTSAATCHVLQIRLRLRIHHQRFALIMYAPKILFIYFIILWFEFSPRQLLISFVVSQKKLKKITISHRIFRIPPDICHQWRHRCGRVPVLPIVFRRSVHKRHRWVQREPMLCWRCHVNVWPRYVGWFHCWPINRKIVCISIYMFRAQVSNQDSLTISRSFSFMSVVVEHIFRPFVIT